MTKSSFLFLPVAKFWTPLDLAAPKRPEVPQPADPVPRAAAQTAGQERRCDLI